VGSLNSLGASLILYVIAGKLGLIRGTSEEALSRRPISEKRALQEEYK
jgi:cytosine permease